ncbi:hypothetical protein J437_LFUL000707 [Ladona fulva]|uniref:Uncharacterized protein n=1 Tax=Ladona fulva TaxID=123851 RepID=A0A8K0JVB1_LADFU|nr:hypothetical protein J437_LFUL000707 [Ladona fulva]
MSVFITSSNLQIALVDGKVDEKATQLHAIASLKVLLDATKPPANGATTASSTIPGAPNHIPSAIAPPVDPTAVGRGGNQETQLVAGGRGAVVGRGGLPIEQPNGVAGSMEGGVSCITQYTSCLLNTSEKGILPHPSESSPLKDDIVSGSPQ